MFLMYEWGDICVNWIFFLNSEKNKQNSIEKNKKKNITRMNKHSLSKTTVIQTPN